MRISTNQIFNSSLQRLLRTQQQLVTDEQKLQEQTKILTPADDPAGAATVLRLNARVALNEQYSENADKVTSSLGRQEAVLEGITSALQRAQTLAVQAGSGALSEQDKNAVGTELAGIEQEVFDLMNSKDEFGNYLFSGFQGDKQTVQFVPGTGTGQFPYGQYVYGGDDGSRELQVSESLKLAVSTSGQEVFESAELRPGFTAPTTTGAASVESVKITDRNTFDNFYDNNYVASDNGNNDFQIDITAGAPDTYEIFQDGVSVATGNYTDGQPIQFQGAEITLNNAVGESVNFSFREPKGNVLSSLRALSQALMSGNKSADELQQFNADFGEHAESALNQISGARSKIGSRQNLAESIQSAIGAQNIADQQTMEDVAGLDLAEGISNLTQTETRLQAIQSTFSRVSNLSLFDYLR